MKRRRELKFVKGAGGLLVPDHIASAVGLGCPRCDDHEVVPLAPEWQLAPIIMGFRGKHRGHGDLETLERREGTLYITGKMPGLE
jgi:hypothetical protein